MRNQAYQDIWVRWIPDTWEDNKGWKSSIQPNILKHHSFKTALFILKDDSCVFIPMDELRRILATHIPNDTGSIILTINPRKRTVEGVRVNLKFIESHTKRTRVRQHILDSFTKD